MYTRSRLLPSWRGEGAPRAVCSFFQPRGPLIGGAVCDDAEHHTVEVLYAAEVEDAVAPKTLQRVAEDLVLPLCGRVGCIEDKRLLRTQQTDGETAAAVACGECVGDILAQNPINPAFEHGGWLPPPVRMDDDDAVRRTNLLLMETDERITRCTADELLLWDGGIEMLAAEIVETYIMAG